VAILAAGASHRVPAQVTAAVLLWRAVTYLPPIALGAAVASYGGVRPRSSTPVRAMLARRACGVDDTCQPAPTALNG